MRFYAPILKVEDGDDDTIKVYGVASTEDPDRQGEIVMASAIKAALPDFFAHGSGALREMHGLSAAGTVDQAEVDEDNKTIVVATVVDPVAIKKVKTGTYKGFSIGGKVVERDKKNRKIITKLALSELSLVDRPANPSAIIDLWKTDAAPEDEIEKREFSADERKKDAKSGASLPDGSFPIENRQDLKNAIRAFGRAKDKAKAKAHIIARAKALGAESFLPESWRGATKKTEGGEDNGVSPVTDEASAADAVEPETIAETVAEAAPEPEADEGVTQGAVDVASDLDAAAKAESLLTQIEGALAAPETDDVAKGMYTVSQLADMLQSLSWMVSSAQNEADMEGDKSPVPSKLRDWLKSGIAIFRDMSKEETDELLASVAAKKAETSDDLAKADAERAEREDLAKRLAERDAAFDKMSERLEKVASDLTARLARVEAAPRAAKTAGPGATAIAISKAEDSVGGASQDAPRQELSQDAIAKALSEMSEEDRTMALIKAARATPKAITYR